MKENEDKGELIWSKNVHILKKNDRRIIANRVSGSWIKISKECFDILEKIISDKLHRDKIGDIFENAEDRTYFLELIQSLKKVGAFFDENKNEERIQYVYFSVTERCNLHCIHCSVSADSMQSEELLTTNDLKDMLDVILDSKPEILIFTGGEPLVRKDIFEVLKYTRGRFEGKIILMTNGTLVNSKNVTDIIENVDSVDMSIDGIDEASCTPIRGAGVFEKVITAVKLLCEYGMEDISLSMVMGKENHHLINEFYALNKTLGTQAIPRVFAERGRGIESTEYFQKQDYLDELSEASVCTQSEYNQKKAELLDQIQACNCGAGKSQITIDNKGDIYPCGLLMDEKYKISNIKKIENLNDLFSKRFLESENNYASLAKIQPENVQQCKTCDVNVFCWSCPELIDRIQGTREFDKRCASLKEYLMDVIWNEI